MFFRHVQAQINCFLVVAFTCVLTIKIQQSVRVDYTCMHFHFQLMRREKRKMLVGVARGRWREKYAKIIPEIGELKCGVCVRKNKNISRSPPSKKTKKNVCEVPVFPFEK